MNHHEVEPPLIEDEPFPCPLCGGGGLLRGETTIRSCSSCGGSGYGPPPPSLDRERAHCLARLAKWAERNLPLSEEKEN